jgi:hypothetical protein
MRPCCYRGVHVHEPQARIADGDAVDGLLEQLPEIALALTKRRVAALAVGDVARDAEHRGHTTPFVTQGHRVCLEPARRALQPCHAELERAARVSAHDALVKRAKLRPVLLSDQLEYGPPLDLIEGVGLEHLQARRIQHEQRTVGVEQCDALGLRVDDRREQPLALVH